MSGPPQFKKWRDFLAREGYSHNIGEWNAMPASTRLELRTKYHGGSPPAKIARKKVYRNSPVIRRYKAKQLFLNSGRSKHAMLLDIKQRKNKSIHHLGTRSSGLYKHPRGPINHDIVGIDDGSSSAIEMWKDHFKRNPGAHRPITKERYDALARGRATSKANRYAKKKATVVQGPTSVSGSNIEPYSYTIRSSGGTTRKNKKGKLVLTDDEKKRRYALRTGKKQSDLTVNKKTGRVMVKKSAGGRGKRTTKN